MLHLKIQLTIKAQGRYLHLYNYISLGCCALGYSVPPPPAGERLGVQMQTLVLKTGSDSSTVQRLVIRVSVKGRYKRMPRVTIGVAR